MTNGATGGEHVTVVCAQCSVEITGILKPDGKIYAARWPRPGRKIRGVCFGCVEAPAVPTEAPQP